MEAGKASTDTETPGVKASEVSIAMDEPTKALSAPELDDEALRATEMIEPVAEISVRTTLLKEESAGMDDAAAAEGGTPGEADDN